jgi:hypothetical protein
MPPQTNRSFIENCPIRLSRGQRTSIVDYHGEAIRTRKRFLKLAPALLARPITDRRIWLGAIPRPTIAMAVSNKAG